MATEIEKKYRVSEAEAESLRVRLRACGAEARGEEFEENTLYAGPGLERGGRVLRLRRVRGGRAVFTFKESMPGSEGIKRRREDETIVSDPEALAAILDALGYVPAAVYEKRRETWHVAGVEVVIDELPFGQFVEIEGAEELILEAERLLELSATLSEPKSYPQLTLENGTRRGAPVEARFEQGEVESG
ncbi:MAG: adenylate cyclase, class 2 [Pyrinomonadaceae bacterium]|jgi:adenylate cyclase class 2|nr:adenylate cyclase, class 2 [Pyrinomonadaceae bacterium]